MWKLNRIFAVGVGLAIVVFGIAADQEAGKKPVRTALHDWRGAVAMQNARSEACAAALPDGRILVTGGSGAEGALTTVEIIQEDGTFSIASPMLNPRQDHSCMALADGIMLVAGGRTNGDGVTNSAELYDPATDRWINAGPMSSARHGATASMLKDGRVLMGDPKTPEQNHEE